MATKTQRIQARIAQLQARNPGITTDDGLKLLGQEPQGSGESMTVEHSTPGLVLLYKRNSEGASEPRLIPQGNVAGCLRPGGGFAFECQDCGDEHCGLSEQTGWNPLKFYDQNACPERAPTQYRTCPICAHAVHDSRNVLDVRPANDPNQIVDETTAISTPATRTDAALRSHMWAYHPTLAPAYSIPRPAVQDPDVHSTQGAN